MTSAVPEGASGPPPPVQYAVNRPWETQVAIDRVYSAAMVMRVTFVMNLAAYLIGAMITASSIFEKYGPRTPEGVLRALGGVGVWLVLAGVNGAGIYGTYQMETLRRRAWAIVATLALMLPCSSPCCLVTIPMGIWAFIGLRRVPPDEWT